MRDAAEDPREAFKRFYEQLHGSGRSPYAWQARLAAELAEGRLFDALEAPTGAGKTTLIECFLFALAWQGESQRRTLPLRLFWVVDRRAVVDQVYAHAGLVAGRLRDARPEDPATFSVAATLRAIGGAGGAADPVQLARWRGGIAFERPTLSPAAPAVICSTVDQVGSRLLFRGYGTSRRSRPLEAAMTGTDSLIVLDEAHIAQPFLETSRAIRRHQESARRPLPRPVAIASVSATLPAGTASHSGFRLTREEQGEASIAARLEASKKTRLRAVGDRVGGLVSEAKRMATEGTVVGVVANTVGEARRAYLSLADGGHARAILIIGPSRPIERDVLLERIPARVERHPQDPPLFVVATQTIEVGLDLDFDALATAAAPFASLAQRFGRLDRAGELGESKACILSDRREDPVYGEAAGQTFGWLEQRATEDSIDLGPARLRELAAQGPPAPSEVPRALLLARHHVEALAQTSADPRPSPEIGYFLHGEEGARDADAQICWRADIREEQVDAEWVERVLARPPHRGELITLPVGALRSWLRGREIDFGDIESTRVQGEDQVGRLHRFVRVPPPNSDGRLVADVARDAGAISPGDVVVVPSPFGGCDEFGWHPSSRAPTADLGNLAEDRPHILIDPALPVLEDPSRALPAKAARVAEEVLEELRVESLSDDPYTRLRQVLRAWADDDPAAGALADARRRGLASLAEAGRTVPLPEADPAGLVIRSAPQQTERRTSPAVGLEPHTERVAELVLQFAQAAGVDDILARSLVVAAKYHDKGKLDPRFQAWLNGGLPAQTTQPLAKSASTGLGPNSWRAAQEAAGWPAGKRHENLSAALLRRVLEQEPDNEIDGELTVHLVATHHGQNRPFLGPEAPDTHPVDVDFSPHGDPFVIRSDAELPWGEHAERFANLCDRFGEWGLAGLEALLVSADRLASAEVGE